MRHCKTFAIEIVLDCSNQECQPRRTPIIQQFRQLLVFNHTHLKFKKLIDCFIIYLFIYFFGLIWRCVLAVLAYNGRIQGDFRTPIFHVSIPFQMYI